MVRLWPRSDPCPGVAAARIHRLQRIEVERFSPLAHGVSPADGCEETGRPAAWLWVRMEGWTSRREGVAYLRQPPWHWDQVRQHATLDGEPGVSAGVTKVEGDGDAGIEISLVLTG